MGSRGRGRDGAGSSRIQELNRPTWWDEHTKSDFGRDNPLRTYNSLKFLWPIYKHNYECVVQMYHHGGLGSGRRFFRCAMGFVSILFSQANIVGTPLLAQINMVFVMQRYEDKANCGYTLWVDPAPILHVQSYIDYLEPALLTSNKTLQRWHRQKRTDLS